LEENTIGNDPQNFMTPDLEEEDYEGNKTSSKEKKNSEADK
jgi:hypothetical protein